MRDWKWMMTAYYADDVQRPKRLGEIAIQTIHRTDTSKDIEVAAALSRSDIGCVDVDLYRDPFRTGILDAPTTTQEGDTNG